MARGVEKQYRGGSEYSIPKGEAIIIIRDSLGTSAAEAKRIVSGLDFEYGKGKGWPCLYRLCDIEDGAQNIRKRHTAAESTQKKKRCVEEAIRTKRGRPLQKAQEEAQPNLEKRVGNDTCHPLYEEPEELEVCMLDYNAAQELINNKIEDCFLGLDKEELEKIKRRAYRNLLDIKKYYDYSSEVLNDAIETFLDTEEKRIERQSRHEEKPYLTCPKLPKRHLPEGNGVKTENYQEFLRRIPVYSIDEKIGNWRDAIDRIFEEYGGATVCLAVQNALRERGIYTQGSEREIMDYIRVRRIAEFFYDEGVRNIDADEAVIIMNKILKTTRIAIASLRKNTKDGIGLFQSPKSMEDIADVINYVIENIEVVNVSPERVKDVLTWLRKRKIGAEEMDKN